MRLILLALGWCIGVAIGLTPSIQNGFSPASWLMIAGITVVILGLAQGNTRVRWPGILLLAFSLGGLRASLSPAAPPLAAYNDQGGYTLEGVIAQPPDARDTYTLFRVEADTLFYNGEAQPTRGAALVRVDNAALPAAPLHYGERVQATGLLVTPMLGDGFSYRDYLARSGIYSQMIAATVARQDEQPPPTLAAQFYQTLYQFRDRVSAGIDVALPQPLAGLLRAMLIGDERGLTERTGDAFTLTGSSHLLVVSGFNLTLLGGFVFRGGRALRVSRGAAAMFGLLGIVIYALLVGATGAVLRAALVSALLLTGEALRRRAFLPTSLAFAAILISLFTPSALWDVGFQLSFSAALGLALFSEPVQNAFVRALPRSQEQGAWAGVFGVLIENLSATLAATALSLPILLLHFGTFSPISLPVNLLIVPLQPYILFIGLAGALLALLLFPLGAAVLWVAALPLGLTWLVVERFARLALTSAELALSPLVAGALYLLIAGGGLWMAARPDLAVVWRRGVRAALLLGGIAGSALLVLLLAVVAARPDGRLHLWFLGTGAGENAVLGRTPGGATFLIDGGAHPQRLLEAIDTHMPPLERTLALVALTQPDPAHYTALADVLRRYDVGRVIGTGQPNNAPAYLRLRETAGERWHTATAGERIAFSDGVALTVLHPAHMPTLDTPPGDGALVLRLNYGQAAFLFANGLSEDGQIALLDEGDAGSRVAGVRVLYNPAADANGVDGAFYTQAAPQVNILPVLSAREAALGADETVWENSTAFRVEEGGWVHVATDGVRLWVDDERPPQAAG